MYYLISLSCIQRRGCENFLVKSLLKEEKVLIRFAET